MTVRASKADNIMRCSAEEWYKMVLEHMIREEQEKIELNGGFLFIMKGT